MNRVRFIAFILAGRSIESPSAAAAVGAAARRANRLDLSWRVTTLVRHEAPDCGQYSTARCVLLSMSTVIALSRPSPAGAERRAGSGRGAGAEGFGNEQRLAAAIAAQGPRLRAFVRRQVADLADVDDIVQDTLVELVAAYRLMLPIGHLAAWLRRVARNRIIDRFRRRARHAGSGREVAPNDRSDADQGMGSDAPDPGTWWDESLAPAAVGPEAGYERAVLADRLMAALAELPPEQRAVFVAHEFDGRSFRELAAETGIGVNTLLGRKHAAVRQLRRRLRDIQAGFVQDEEAT
jgi:RNA polymerase sigma factor (sigma-70 family)